MKRNPLRFRRYQCQTCAAVTQFLSTGPGEGTRRRCLGCSRSTGPEVVRLFLYIGSESTDPKLLDG